MTGPSTHWGDDPTTIGGYALAAADVVVRLLLPPEDENGDPTTWGAVAAAFDRSDQLNGYVSWHRLTELPGAGTGPVPSFRAAAGRVPEPILATVDGILRGLAADRAWRVDPPAGDAVAVTSLTRYGESPLPSRLRRTTQQQGPFSVVSVEWSRHGFAGRAWSMEASIGVAAPPYADSLIISGPVQLGEAILAAADLEAFSVSPRAELPITTE